jgi:hypothetical protein
MAKDKQKKHEVAEATAASAKMSRKKFEKELAWISEGASQSWCSPAGESPARVRPSEPPGSK